MGAARTCVIMTRRRSKGLGLGLSFLTRMSLKYSTYLSNEYRCEGPLEYASRVALNYGISVPLLRGLLDAILDLGTLLSKVIQCLQGILHSRIKVDRSR